MNQIRFTVLDGERVVHQTPWHPESGKDDALRVLTEVRKQISGNYAYRIDRTGDSKQPNEVPQFRYKIFVREGRIKVWDKNEPGGIGIRHISNQDLFSRVFQEHEREQVIKEIREMFPDGQLTEEKF